jgi:O-antigen/teichoic acid export membrane protein
MMNGLNKKISIGVAWNFASLAINKGWAILVTLILARFLAPEHFGRLALLLAVLGLSNVIVNAGLGQALIRAKNIQESDVNTVFTFNIILSVCIFAIVYVSAPHIALLCNQPRLAILLQVASVAILINGWKVVPNALLSRELNFKSLASVNTLSNIFAGLVAIFLAARGFQDWSLVAQIVLASFLSTILLLFKRLWTIKFHINLLSLKQSTSFGINLMIEGMIGVLFQNSYVLVIGIVFSVEAAGLYFLARRVTQLFYEQMSRSVQQVTFPALATLQSDDTKLRNKYRQIIEILMFGVAPVMLFLVVFADELLLLILGQAWSSAAYYVQVLSILGLLYPLHAMNMNILSVKGRSDIFLKIGIFKYTVQLIILFLAIPYGVEGIVLGQLIGSIISLAPNTYFSSKLIGYSFSCQLQDAARPLAAAVLCSLLGFFTNQLLLQHLPSWLALAIGGLTMVLTYLVFSYLFRVTKTVEAFLSETN